MRSSVWGYERVLKSGRPATAVPGSGGGDRVLSGKSALRKAVLDDEGFLKLLKGD